MRCELCGHEDKSAVEKADAEGAPEKAMAYDILLMVDHLRLFHPEYGEPETWPDGSLVLHDDTLEPGDFA